MPVPKNTRLAKKGGGPYLLKADSHRFQPSQPFPPRPFAEWNQEGLKKIDPGPFWLRRLPLGPGNKITGLIDRQSGNRSKELLPNKF